MQATEGIYTEIGSVIFFLNKICKELFFVLLLHPISKGGKKNLLMRNGV